MLACRSLRALLVEQWSAAAAPKDGHMTMVVDGSEGVARWQRFFRAGVQMPVRSLDLVLRGQLQTSYLRLHDLVLQLCKCFEASLRVLHISTAWIGDASFVCAAAGLRLLALRQLTLEMPTAGYSYMSFNLDLRWAQAAGAGAAAAGGADAAAAGGAAAGGADAAAAAAAVAAAGTSRWSGWTCG